MNTLTELFKERKSLLRIINALNLFDDSYKDKLKRLQQIEVEIQKITREISFNSSPTGNYPK